MSIWFWQPVTLQNLISTPDTKVYITLVIEEKWFMPGAELDLLMISIFDLILKF